MTKDWPMKEWPAPPSPAPPEEPQPIAPPAPDPPTEGWWLDPDDPRRIRYHDGQAWTDRLGRSTAPRPGLPAHQAWFPLGAGPEGIPTGSPLAPGEGRYLAPGTVWALGGVLIAGMLVGAYGIGALQEDMLGGAAAAAVIALGAVLFFGPIGICLVSAWRAGFRYPGFSRDSSLFERQLGLMILAGAIAATLEAVSHGIGVETSVGAVLQVLAYVTGALVVGFYAIPTVWSVVRHPEEYESGGRWLNLGLALGTSLLLILWIAGVLPDGNKFD